MRDDVATKVASLGDRREGALEPHRSNDASDALTAVDLERRRERETVLSAGAEMLKATFNNVRHGFLLLDDQLRVRSFNPRLAELIGFPPGVLLEGATARDLIGASAALGHYPGSSADEAYELWTRRLANRTPGHHRSRSSDGRTTKIGCLPFGEGEWIITYEDISARIDAEEALAAQNERFEAALANLPHGVCMFDAEKRLILCNAAYAKLYALPTELTVAGTPLQRILDHRAAVGMAPIELTGYYQMVSEAEAAGDARSVRVPLQDGRTMRVAHKPMRGGGFVASHEDITEAVRSEQQIRDLASQRILAEEALAEQNRRFDAALTNMPHGVCMFDADTNLILCNPGYATLYALPPELTVAGTPLQRILDHRAALGTAPLEMATYFNVVGEAKAAGGARSTRVALQDGRTVRIAHNPMSGGGYVATHEDITEAVRAEQQIRYLGSHDGLTGLPNRAELSDHIVEALARARRGEMFCLHYLDLDNFKFVNDAHGHSIGDLVLKQAAARLRLCLGETDMLARIGGDEFVVLQTDLEKPEQAGNLARRLVEAMAPPFDLDGRQASIGVSVGVSVCPSDGVDADVLLKNADMAMYRAKSEGRNTYRFFELAMDARIQERRRLELDLRRAVANEEFEVFYQPQVDAQTEAITGCEALLRWRHPTRGMVPPNNFIAVAEEIGVIVPIGAWVIQQACRDAATWPRHIGVAVNLSSQQFKGLSLVQTVVSALDASGLSPTRLELEVTESALLADNASTLATLEHLRALGVRIAMDDFGTGYSSLSYLRSFPFDKIKIDRSFIKDFGEKRDCSAIVRAVAGLGAELGMTTTAEGVETAEQLRQIRSLGCTEVQGYYFGKPRPAKELPALFRKNAAAA